MIGNKWLNPRYTPSFDEVTIGTQTWMASNLAIDDGQGDIFIQPNVVTNGVSLGNQYFYNYTSASRIANSIPGWHLPTVSEYLTLLTYLNGGSSITESDISQTALRKMMSTNSGWNSSSSPNNNSGFSAKPVGAVDTNELYIECDDGSEGQIIQLLTSTTDSNSNVGCKSCLIIVSTMFRWTPLGMIQSPSINKGSVRLIKDT